MEEWRLREQRQRRVAAKAKAAAAALRVQRGEAAATTNGSNVAGDPVLGFRSGMAAPLRHLRAARRVAANAAQAARGGNRSAAVRMGDRERGGRGEKRWAGAWRQFLRQCVRKNDRNVLWYIEIF